MEEIGRRFGLGAERIRDIARKGGVPPRYAPGIPKGPAPLRKRHPFRLDLMPKACRELARKIRADGRSVSLSADRGDTRNVVSAADAARSLEAQAERWEREIATGQRNEVDRRKLGE